MKTATTGRKCKQCDVIKFFHCSYAPFLDHVKSNESHL